MIFLLSIFFIVVAVCVFLSYLMECIFFWKIAHFLLPLLILGFRNIYLDGKGSKQKRTWLSSGGEKLVFECGVAESSGEKMDFAGASCVGI